MKEHPLPAQLRNAAKIYGETVAVRHLNLALHAGETLALLGPNGAGKTTAIRLLLGLTRPSAGTATIFGADPTRPANRARVGAMLQVAHVPATLTVREHVTLFSSYYPKPLPVRETLALAALESVENRQFGQLSGGQKQRLFFALAICGDPAVLVLDEPTVGLDVETRLILWERIRAMTARGTSLLLTTHYLAEAEALADRIALLRNGSIVAEGTTEDLKRDARAATLQDAYLTLTQPAVFEAVS